MTNIKYLWGAIAILAIVLVVMLFSGRSITQIIQNPLGAVAGPILPNPNFTSELGTHVVSSTFTVSTSTPVLTANPFPASSTIDYMELNQTGTHGGQIHYNCGTSYTKGGAPTIDIITSGNVASSTKAGLIVNNVTNSQGAQVSGGSVARLIIGPNQYLLCQVQVSNDVATSSAALTGTWSARFLEDKR